MVPFLEQALYSSAKEKIVQVNESRNVPNGYFEIDLDEKYIYPGFIDIYTEYGIPAS